MVRQSFLQCEILYEQVRELMQKRNLSIRSCCNIVATREHLSLNKVRDNFYYVIKQRSKVIVKVNHLITLECSQCSKKFERKRSKVKYNNEKGYQNYCSEKCRDIGQIRLNANLLIDIGRRKNDHW